MENKIVEVHKDIFLCPDTKEELMFVKKNENEATFINKFETKFGSKDGFVDFVGVFSGDKVLKRRRKKKGKKEFPDHFDDMMTSSTWYFKMMNKIMWGQELDPKKFQNAMKVFLTELREGFVLDFPIRTGIISWTVYREFPKIIFVTGDYKIDMLARAYERLYSKNIDNAILLQAEPTKLPLKPNLFDGIVSFNGLNFFENFREILKEFYRVAKQGATLIGTCYVQGLKKMSDDIVKKVFMPKGLIKSVFTKEELVEAMNKAGFEDVIVTKFNAEPLMRFSAKKPTN